MQPLLDVFGSWEGGPSRELLIDLARGLRHDSLADRFQLALDAEAEHLLLVKGWLAAGVATEARAPWSPRPSPRLEDGVQAGRHALAGRGGRTQLVASHTTSSGSREAMPCS
ncbi:hypothetical protein [Corallococcus sp. CA053C]|uniref:hypothetical protein n=1 Tax=Corallococcus sp. CA053C TaxID=2316732 RepID=UPI001F3DA242|nr:hypothetical protein [Corallococcus sp. CA053C]